MPILKHCSKLFLSVLTAGALSAACGSSEDPSTPGQYVVDDIFIPNNAVASAIDLNGDGTNDNNVGTILNTLGSLAGIDIQSAITDDINNGATILLVRVEADSFSNDDTITAEVLRGQNANPAACAGEDDTECGNHLNGGASFDLQAGASQGTPLQGSVDRSDMLVGPGQASIDISFSMAGDSLELNLELATLSGMLRAAEINDGIIGGAITEADMQNSLIPQVVVTLNEAVALDCALDPAAGCCDSATSTGAQVLAFLNKNDDCVLSLEEVRDDPNVQSLLTPDIDLSGNGTEDAFSLGLGFSAVGANF